MLVCDFDRAPDASADLQTTDKTDMMQGLTSTFTLTSQRMQYTVSTYTPFTHTAKRAHLLLLKIAHITGRELRDLGAGACDSATSLNLCW
jgi:hypothetical protein